MQTEHNFAWSLRFLYKNIVIKLMGHDSSKTANKKIGE